MSGFLAHLARMAMGEMPDGSVRPELPPRFAPVGDDAPGSSQDRITGAFEPRVAIASDNLQAAEADSSVTAGGASTGPHRPPKYEAPKSATLSSMPVEPSLGAHAISTTAQAPHSPVRPNQRPEQAVTDGRRRPERPIAPIAQPSGPRPEIASPAEATPSHSDLGWPTGPLSKSILASRVQPARSADPVIHVTIDRIDVRAPAKPPVPTPRRIPREPSVSLSDFLHGKRAEG